MPLDRSLAERLRQHKTRLAPLAKSDDWVFANPETGKPYWPGRIQENWLVPAAEKAGDRPNRLAHVSPQPFNAASCPWSRSQGAAGTFAARRYSNDYEYLHAGSSDAPRSEQYSGSSSAPGASCLTLMAPCGPSKSHK